MIDLREGDCLEVMAGLAGASVDAVVTDVPSSIGFMGKDWDHHKGGRDRWVGWLAERMAAALRVARPGAHALVWAIPRRSHWTALALEDAGWTIDDRIAHIFGQGFPKHRSKLKPAVEDWWLCTKPGGAKWLGVDACRVNWDADSLARDTARRQSPRTDITGGSFGNASGGQVAGGYVGETESPSGRWPTNLVFTHHPDCQPCGERRVKTQWSQATEHGEFKGWSKHQNGQVKPIGYAGPDGLETVAAWRCAEGLCPVAELDRQSGISGENRPRILRRLKDTTGWSGGSRAHDDTGQVHVDVGGASRFFPTFAWQADDFFPALYCPKASRRDRGPGNTHPTVKPQQLMRWLCRLVTPPGGTVLDPFAGSGTTGRAAHAEGFDAVLIEGDPEYVALARRLNDAWLAETPLLT